MLKRAKIELFGSNSNTTMRILKHKNIKDLFKTHDNLEPNTFDYICIKIPDVVKSQMKQNGTFAYFV